jgi:hypothetical protein
MDVLHVLDPKRQGFVVGWPALREFTQYSEQFLRKATAMYGFPKAAKFRDGHKLFNAWNKKDVGAWIAQYNLRQAGIQIQKGSPWKK